MKILKVSAIETSGNESSFFIPYEDLIIDKSCSEQLQQYGINKIPGTYTGTQLHKANDTNPLMSLWYSLHSVEDPHVKKNWFEFFGKIQKSDDCKYTIDACIVDSKDLDPEILSALDVNLQKTSETYSKRSD